MSILVEYKILYLLFMNKNLKGTYKTINKITELLKILEMVVKVALYRYQKGYGVMT